MDKQAEYAKEKKHKNGIRHLQVHGLHRANEIGFGAERQETERFGKEKRLREIEGERNGFDRIVELSGRA